VPTNPQQEGFLRQARSDFEVYQLLARRGQCHRLHYLQMNTEKLAKTYFWAAGAGPRKHDVFVDFLKAVELRPDFHRMFGYRDPQAKAHQQPAIFALARRIEGLAPAGNPGPNPEYPWPRTMPTIAPVDHDFAEWHEWNETTAGRRLHAFVKKLLADYNIYFP